MKWIYLGYFKKWKKDQHMQLLILIGTLPSSNLSIIHIINLMILFTIYTKIDWQERKKE